MARKIQTMAGLTQEQRGIAALQCPTAPSPSSSVFAPLKTVSPHQRRVNQSRHPEKIAHPRDAALRRNGSNVRQMSAVLDAAHQQSRASSCKTLSRVISSLAAVFCVKRPISACISGFWRFSEPIFPAVFELYPDRMAACVALKSTTYSRQNRSCFAVSVLSDIKPPVWRKSAELIKCGDGEKESRPQKRVVVRLFHD